jgi:hypothetical protein
MVAFPYGAAVLTQADVQAGLVFLSALCRAPRARHLVLANVMVAKPDALGRECGNYVHYSINGAGFAPAAS